MIYRLRNILAVLFVLVWACAAITAASNSVYITPQGKRYHRVDCRNTHAGKMKITRVEAKKRGYSACKVCKP